MPLPKLSQTLSSSPSFPRAVVYLPATQGEDDGFYTIEQQTRLLAQQEGYELITLYKDMGRGWDHVEKPSGLKERFTAARAEHFSIRFLQDFSRFSRDPEKPRRLAREIKAVGILEVKFLNQPTLIASILTFPFLARLYKLICSSPQQGKGRSAQKGRKPDSISEFWRK